MYNDDFTDVVPKRPILYELKQFIKSFKSGTDRRYYLDILVILACIFFFLITQMIMCNEAGATPDKQDHYRFGYTFTELQADEIEPGVFVGVCGVAVYKEAYDFVTTGEFDSWDMYWTWFGSWDAVWNNEPRFNLTVV